MSRQELWVTPMYVNGPRRQGDRHGSIKTRELGYVSIPVDRLRDFQKGERAFITVETTDRGYNNFVEFANQRDGGSQYEGYRPEAHRNPPPRPVQQARPPVQRPLPQQRPQTSPNTEARDIFITGVTGRAMGSGKFTSTDILTLTLAAKAAWEQVVMGITSKPEFDDAMPSLDDDRPPTRGYDPNRNFTSVDDDEIPPF